MFLMRTSLKNRFEKPENKGGYFQSHVTTLPSNLFQYISIDKKRQKGMKSEKKVSLSGYISIYAK